MSSRLCPFCMKISEDEVCPHCGKNINYTGSTAHLPAGYVVSGKHPYVLGAALGQGGFGITYIALDMVTNERVAIKEYYPTYCSARTMGTCVSAYSNQEEVYQKGQERFLDEARTLKSLSDLKSIVKVQDFFKANNSAYLVMEFLDGISLKDYAAKNGKFPAQEFLKQMKPLMEDIHRMHERGVIHRDIAPDNIILLPDGQLKLIDFGAARSYVGDKSMTVVVKKGFAPLEQYITKGATASTDVYALAATIYYCITGVVPIDSAERQCDATPLTALADLGADLTPFQEQALTKALEIQQKARTQTVQELLNGLHTTAASESEKKEDTDDKKQTKSENISKKIQPVPDSGTTEETLQGEESIPKVKNHTWKMPQKKAIAGILIFVLLAGCTLFALTGNRRKYNRACTHLSQQQFEEASLLFAELGTYKDSQMLRNQATYSRAEQLLADKQYEEASRLFLELGDHEDSKEKWEKATYTWAESLCNEKKFAEALGILEKIPNYRNTSLFDEIHYQNGLIYLESNQYADAFAELSQVSASHKAAADAFSNLKTDWAKSIISTKNLATARTFVRDVKLTAAESKDLYEYIINQDYYPSYTYSYPDMLDFPTRNCMLEALVGEFPLKASLSKLFQKLNIDNPEDFIRENHELIAELWDIPVMQNIIKEDWNLCIWLLGKWKANNGLSIHFYEKENDASIWSRISLPWVAEPKGTMHWDIKDMEYIWTGENDEKLATVYKFELTGPNTMDVYCYKNQKTYTVTRST